MSKDKLNIPPKINVGFQKRDDTYTGKLAYVVYTDAKGKLRKETSWNGWCNHKQIPPVSFPNEPTSGFVLNKKVGEDHYGWNPRKAWIRVYDPRDFEFEISVANLLFILEETSAIKGKGLEGDFVYAWDGADLVLLPVDSQEYQKSKRYTALQQKKITKQDMKEGCVYRNKEGQEVLYLGRHDYYEMVDGGYRNGYRKQLKHQKCHIFVLPDGKYWTQSGFTKLAEKLCEDTDPRFADEYDKYIKSAHNSKPVRLIGKRATLPLSNNSYYYSHKPYYLKDGDTYYAVVIQQRYGYGYGYGNNRNIEYEVRRATKGVKLEKDTISTGDVWGSRSVRTLSQEDVKKLEIYDLFVENNQGNVLQI